MKAVGVVLLAVLVSACSANVHIRSALAPPPPAGHGAGASVNVGVQSSSLAALIFAGLLLGAALESFRSEREAPTQPAPLAPDRAVNEQDCSRPIADPYANLKCR